MTDGRHLDLGLRGPAGVPWFRVGDCLVDGYRRRWLGACVTRRWTVWPAVAGLVAGSAVLAVAPALWEQLGWTVPAWVPALLLAVAGIVGSAVLSPLLAAQVKMLTYWVDRREAGRARQAEAVARSGGGGGLPLVREVTSRRVLGIHAAIPLRAGHVAGLSVELPEYVPRDRDERVYTELTRMAVSGGFLLLVGEPAAGKTRCAATAVHRLLGDWRLLVPEGAAGLAAVVDSGVNMARTVVWLDDLHELVESGGAGSSDSSRLAAALLRRLFLPKVGPVVVIGTTWPDKHRLYSQEPAGGADLYGEARQIVRMAEVIDLASEFSDTELGRAMELAAVDPRIAEALHTGNDRRLAATLANAPRLVLRWRAGDNPYVVAVLDAAVDARRAGHPPVLSPDLLRRLAAMPGS